MNHVIIFCGALLLSLLLTPIVKRVMLKSNILDTPSESRWNRRPVALMGGIAIFVSFVLVALFSVNWGREMWVPLLGGGIIFLLGVLDDGFGTHPKIKFTIQLVVALGVACLGVTIKILPYSWLNILVTVLWIVGLTNALNLLDNIDGLSSGITVIAALGILGVSFMKDEVNAGMLSLALAGSCLGFLRYNFNPAQIFMGDCGSMFLGYMLAILSILGGWQHSSPVLPSFLPPIFILSVAIFDTTLVTVLRLKHGRLPWQGGRDHLSHRLVALLGGSEKDAVLILYSIGAVTGGLALLTVRLESSLFATFVAVVLGVGAILLGIRVAKVECYDKEHDLKG